MTSGSYDVTIEAAASESTCDEVEIETLEVCPVATEVQTLESEIIESDDVVDVVKVSNEARLTVAPADLAPAADVAVEPAAPAPAYPKTIVLTKENGVRLGFNIGRRAEGDGEGILISDVTAGSPSDGLLSVGDIVTCVNARNVSNGKLKPAKVEIRESASTVTFTIVGNVTEDAAEVKPEAANAGLLLSAVVPNDEAQKEDVQVLIAEAALAPSPDVVAVNMTLEESETTIVQDESITAPVPAPAPTPKETAPSPAPNETAPAPTAVPASVPAPAPAPLPSPAAPNETVTASAPAPAKEMSPLSAATAAATPAASLRTVSAPAADVAVEPAAPAPAYPKTIVLTKENGVRLGFNIGRRAEGDGEGILISDVTAGSPSDGLLSVGDIVTCVNARNVSNGKLKPAKVEIRESASTVTFTIVGNVTEDAAEVKPEAPACAAEEDSNVKLALEEPAACAAVEEAPIHAPVAAPRPAVLAKAPSTNELLANQVIGTFDFNILDGISLLDLDANSADGKSDSEDLDMFPVQTNISGGCTSPEGFEVDEPASILLDGSSSSASSSAHSHNDTVGDCMNCESFKVEGSYSDEDAQFFCATCWSYYDEEGENEEEAEEVKEVDCTEVALAAAAAAPQPQKQEQRSEQPRVLRLSVLTECNEEGEEDPSNESEVDDVAIFDADGLPVSRGDCKSFASWVPPEENLNNEPSSCSTLSSASQQQTTRINQLSTKELMMLASPKGARKAAAKKLGPVAASLDQRREGPCFMGTGTLWKRRYLVLQGTILKVYKQQKKKNNAEYVILSPETRAKRTAKRELALLTTTKGVKHTSYFRFTSKTECTEWCRVLQNILGNIHPMSVC